MSALWRDRRSAVGGALLAVVIVTALAAPFVTAGDVDVPYDVVATRFLAPLSHDVHGAFHLLGTDRIGRDVWTRLVYGGRISLAVGFLSVALSVTLGMLVGGLAGWWRGWPAAALTALTDFALALPRVVVLLLLAALWRPNTSLVILFLGMTGWMPVARLVRGEVQTLSTHPFVEGARASGARPLWVLWRHVLPNALTPVFIIAALGVGNAILVEAGLSYFGLGVQPPTPSWGNMIASGRDTLVNAPWVAAAPGVFLALVVVGCTLVGDGLRDAMSGQRSALSRQL
jgi:peptide/nickel transport system permease protein